jgi:hypothetical protein
MFRALRLRLMEPRVFSRRVVNTAEGSREYGSGTATRHGPFMWGESKHVLLRNFLIWKRARTEMADVRYVCRSMGVREALEVTDVIENGLYA